MVRGCREGFSSVFPVASQAEAKGLDTVDVGFVQGPHTDTPADAPARAFKPSFGFSQQWANRRQLNMRRKSNAKNKCVEECLPKSSAGTEGAEDYSRSQSDMKGRWFQFSGCREGHPARTHEKMIKFSYRRRSSVWTSGSARCSPSSDRAERRHGNAIVFSRIRGAKFCGGGSGIR